MVCHLVLVELDGIKQAPIMHGKTTDSTLLQDSVKIVQQFMDRDQGDIRFNISALGQGFD